MILHLHFEGSFIIDQNTPRMGNDRQSTFCLGVIYSEGTTFHNIAGTILYKLHMSIVYLHHMVDNDLYHLTLCNLSSQSRVELRLD